MSPLLFALAADLLLKRLSRNLPEATVRAYADDLAMVIPNYQERLPALELIFEEYERLSGLKLHHGKSVIVPLFKTLIDEFRENVHSCAPSWADFSIQFRAKYLGFYLGPDRADVSWEKPFKKFLERAKVWGCIGGGMLISIVAFRTFIAPVLSFVGQLDNLPHSWEQLERRACRVLFRGPTGWITPGCLRACKHLGLPAELPDLRVSALAAKCRVFRYEDARRGGLRVAARVRALDSLCSDVNDDCIPLNWLLWLKGSFLHKLAQAQEQLSECDPRLEKVVGITGDAEKSRRVNWQRACYAVLRPPHADCALRHLRRRLDRWQLDLPPGRRVGRAVLLLQGLAGHVPPRVIAAILRTLCNGVITARRFQQKGACRFGCGGEDSLEHYAGCQHVRDFYRAALGLHLTGLASFLLLLPAPPGVLFKGALGVYALSHALNHARHQGLSFVQAREALAQGLHQAVRAG